MLELKKAEKLQEEKVQLLNNWRNAIQIIDIKGDDYITEYMDESSSIEFKELADEIWDYYDEFENISQETIIDWNSRLEEYLSWF